MKMIDVLNMMAKDKIKKDTKLEIVSDNNELYRYVYTIDEGKFCFLGEDGSSFCDTFRVDEGFLLEDVELIPPKEKKYLVKFNMRGLRDERVYLNYTCLKNYVELNSLVETTNLKTRFTKDELQTIQPVKEFLEDMEGKYELIEVEDNEAD